MDTTGSNAPLTVSTSRPTPTSPPPVTQLPPTPSPTQATTSTPVPTLQPPTLAANTTTTTNTTTLTTTSSTSTNLQIPSVPNTVGPILKKPKSRPSPYPTVNPILLKPDRQNNRKKSISWQSDEKITKIHYFEYIPDERINVTNKNPDQQNDPNASASGSSLMANNKTMGGKIANCSVDPIRRFSGRGENEKLYEYLPWRLVLIDYKPDLPAPGWKSIERSAQAERETYVLGAIDLPGQPSILDEPDHHQLRSGSSSANGTSSSITTDMNTKDGMSDVKIIPEDNVDGMYTEYNGMYSGDCVNGIKMQNDNPQPVVQNMSPFCGQQSQILQSQFQQQLVHVTQNPFNFQDMGAQFQQPAQMQIQFPLQQQQSIHQGQQQQIMPFTSQQQPLQVPMQQQPTNFVDQQTGMTTPVMPWLNYPFNHVNENTHAHLFRRPAT